MLEYGQTLGIWFFQTVRHWGLFVSGATASLAGWLLLAFGVQSVPATVMAAVGGALLVIAAFRAVHDLRIERDEAKESLKPRLQLMFDATRTDSLYDTLHLDGTIRHIRLAVMNHGTSVDNVAVKVTRLTPQPIGVYPMQELRLTHREDESRFTANKSSEPITFVEFITQAVNQVSGVTMRMLIEFVGGKRDLPLDVDMYLLWCEIDGEGADSPRKFVLTRNRRGQFDLDVAPFN
jgi:hypothetical protein